MRVFKDRYKARSRRLAGQDHTTHLSLIGQHVCFEESHSLVLWEKRFGFPNAGVVPSQVIFGRLHIHLHLRVSQDLRRYQEKKRREDCQLKRIGDKH